MKKVLFVTIIFLIIFLIYIIYKDNKVYYLSLGDELSAGYNENNKEDYGYYEYVCKYLKDNKLYEKCVNGFFKEGIRALDMINMIKENTKIDIDGNQLSIQNALIKADIITLSIGSNDIISKLTLYELYSEDEIYNYINEYLIDLENLFNLIRKYSKEKIIFIGYYNIINDNAVDKYYNYLIDKTIKLASKYKIEYIDIYDDLNNYRTKNLYPNKLGYKLISEKIIQIIDK